MTTKAAWQATVVILLGAMLQGGCITGQSARRGGLPSETVADYPDGVRQAYGLFASRCSRCHTLSRPLNAAIYEHSHWENYVGRMRRHPGSGISSADAERILVFLRYYADQKAKAAGILKRESFDDEEQDS